MKKSFEDIYQELDEGVYDPNIFKAIFLAGGPGSGKSYIAGRTIRGQGLKVINSDNQFERLLNKANLSLKMPDKEADLRDPVRARAKALTAKQKANYIEGRLGLIIDGTARDFKALTDQARDLQILGYDTYMVFVNTSLDVAIHRNSKRTRQVSEPLLIKSWKAVQANIGKFSMFFRKGFIIVDNNNPDEDIFLQVTKRVQALLKQKVQNGRARLWIQQQLDLKKR